MQWLLRRVSWEADRIEACFYRDELLPQRRRSKRRSSLLSWDGLHARFCLLRQCQDDLEAIHAAAVENDSCGAVVQSRLVRIRRLVSEQAESVRRCCLDLSLTLFEKVLCQIPFVLVTRDGRRAMDLIETADEQADYEMIRYAIFKRVCCIVLCNDFAARPW